MLEEGKLEMGHARALLGLDGEAQFDAARQVAQKGLSVREAEQLVRRLSGAKKPAAGKAAAVNPDVARLQGELAEKIGAKVEFQHGAGGKGRLVIHYNSLDELDGILDHIR
jgi:ParB family chromosome partitioning protein